MIRASAALPLATPTDSYWQWYAAILMAGAATLLTLAVDEPRLVHWYVLPVFLCLTVVSLDTAALACGRTSLSSSALRASGCRSPSGYARPWPPTRATRRPSPTPGRH